jgi:hypothetical protein
MSAGRCIVAFPMRAARADRIDKPVNPIQRREGDPHREGGVHHAGLLRHVWENPEQSHANHDARADRRKLTAYRSGSHGVNAYHRAHYVHGEKYKKNGVHYVRQTLKVA